MSKGPRKPVCSGCPHNFWYSDTIPMRKQGVMMHLGERFCLGGKKARRFKRSDPKISVPDWCPLRKTPCELRLYGFKSFRDEWMHLELCRSFDKACPPEERRYALIFEGPTELSPRDFWERCETMLNPTEELLEDPIRLYQILEIDDGVKPAFFYKTEQGFKLLHSFKAETARKNKLEED